MLDQITELSDFLIVSLLLIIFMYLLGKQCIVILNHIYFVLSTYFLLDIGSKLAFYLTLSGPFSTYCILQMKVKIYRVQSDVIARYIMNSRQDISLNSTLST